MWDFLEPDAARKVLVVTSCLNISIAQIMRVHVRSLRNDILWWYWRISASAHSVRASQPEAYSEICQTSEMERFAKIAVFNYFNTKTLAKHSILDIW